MLSLERRQEIIKFMKKKNAVTVTELGKRFYISESTIRRDLEILAQENLVKRTYGGAVYLGGLNSDMPLVMRENENNGKKDRIARAASKFIKNGVTVFMDSSSTAAKTVPYFEGKTGITVVTNAINTAAKLGEYNNLSIYCTGGKIRKKSLSLVGNSSKAFYAKYYADVVFFSCRGIDMQKGITDATEEESEIKQQMLANSKVKVLLCDTSKLGQVYFSLICPISDVDYIILDNEAGSDVVQDLESFGVSVIIA